MPAILAAEGELRVGSAIVIEGPSPAPPYEAVFEDDGATGYFYALDSSRADNPIVDALHIYDVQSVTDRNVPSHVQIIWSADNLKAALLINDYPHAVFDFESRLGYCRDGFGASDAGWSPRGHDWDDSAMLPFCDEEE